MEDQRSRSGFSPYPNDLDRPVAQPVSLSTHPRYAFTAFASVLILIGAAAWSTVSFVEAAQRDLNVTFPDPTPIEQATSSTSAAAAVLASSTIATPADVAPTVLSALAESYQTMQSEGTFSDPNTAAAAEEIVSKVQVPLAYTTYTASDVASTSDTSYARMLQYRADMKRALSPLMKNVHPEFELIGEYVDTGSQTYLTQLRTAAANYQSAADNMKSVVVPSDAVDLHIAGMNALSQYASTLEAFADNAQDPLTATMLLRNLEDGEGNIVSSFNAIAQYYANHPQP